MHINTQPIEKRNHRDDHKLFVHSIFHTIQGEGPLTGHPAIFIRLSGCNLQCPMCDTDYTSKAKLMDPGEIMNHVRDLHAGPRLVVITGGEPFRQNINDLCFKLIDEDYEVQIETNGTLAPALGFPGGFYGDKGAMIVCSPKAGRIHPDIKHLAMSYKYVLSHDSVSLVDGLPIEALGHSAWPTVGRPPHEFPIGAVYLQPADAQDEEINRKNLQAVIESCMRYGYTLQLQTHKILQLE